VAKRQGRSYNTNDPSQYLKSMSQNRPSAFSSLRMGGKDAPNTRTTSAFLPRTADTRNRSYSREGPGWTDRRNEGSGVHTVQDRGQWLIWRGIPDQALTKWRGCSDQACTSRQEIQGIFLLFSSDLYATDMLARIESSRLCASSDIPTLLS
jgi:hypothetical protein